MQATKYSCGKNCNLNFLKIFGAQIPGSPLKISPLWKGFFNEHPIAVAYFADMIMARSFRLN
jgi:hypothetical protein